MEKKPKGKYQDIINLPHHVSKTHPQMPLYDRAAQFSPFAALTGYEDAIRETARLTDNWVQLSEDKKQELDEKLRQLIADRERTESVTIIYFQPDDRKEGGSYVTVTGQIARLIGWDKNSRLVGKVLSMAEFYGKYPCHRVVNHAGRTAPGWREQRELLEDEGVEFKANGCVDMKRHQWEE